jgi:hypothetical protein
MRYHITTPNIPSIQAAAAALNGVPFKLEAAMEIAKHLSNTHSCGVTIRGVKPGRKTNKQLKIVVYYETVAVQEKIEFTSTTPVVKFTSAAVVFPTETPAPPTTDASATEAPKKKRGRPRKNVETPAQNPSSTIVDALKRKSQAITKLNEDLT